VLELPFSECDKLAKLVPEDPKITLKKALEINPEFKKEYEHNENCKRILDYGFVLEGLFRNAGTHAAGVVIGEKPLIEIVPLTRDKEGQTITQYAMEPIGKIGLLKMDFLGLKTLTVIQEAVELIKQTRGETVDIANVPVNDAKTYELLQRGDTVGVFQFESGGMRDMLSKLGPTMIEELIAMNALYRPGAMEFIGSFINRKHGREPIEYAHPMMEPILKETYGYMVYQEQVQRVANVLAGFSLGMADLLRRAIGKKKADEMAKMRKKFVDGCATTNNIPAKKAGEIFDTIEKFAGYGFNKSHSAAYSMVAFQTAYLKAHYPEEFMAALLSSEMGNLDKIPVFISECREMGLEILSPHINESEVRFKPVKGGVRYGLAGIKNVGEGAAKEVVAVRGRGGAYTGLMDLCSRVQGQVVNKKTLESLIRCGAVDIGKEHRARLFNGVDFAMNRATAAAKDKASGQGSLFDMLSSGAVQALTDDQIPNCESWHESELLIGERELLGVYMTGHPLSQHERLLKRYQLSDVQGLSTLPENSQTRLGGLISGLSQRFTKKKEPMATFRLEDLDGNVEVVVYPDSYRDYKHVLVPDRAVIICGEVKKEESSVKIVASEIYPIEEAPRLFVDHFGIHVTVSQEHMGMLEKVRDMLALHPGRTPVKICLKFPGGEKVFLDTDSSYKVTCNEELVVAVERLVGENHAYVALKDVICLKPKRQRFRGGGEEGHAGGG
jgi:DNA polymerase-3 subunit alpha